MYLNPKEAKEFYKSYQTMKQHYQLLEYAINNNELHNIQLMCMTVVTKELEKLDTIIYDNLPPFVNSSGNVAQDQSDIIND